MSVERIKEYQETEVEAEFEKKSELDLPLPWPEIGKIEFDNYKARYRKELDLVLKGVYIYFSQVQSLTLVRFKQFPVVIQSNFLTLRIPDLKPIR